MEYATYPDGEDIDRGLLSVVDKCDEACGTVWNAAGRDVASGISFCRLKAGDFSQTIKMVVVR